VSETQHDAIDDGFHEIQLSGKQLVFLFMATTIVAVVIFLCGVQVGRNVKGGDRLATGEPSDTVASAATAPPPASTPTEAAPSSGPPAAEPPAPAQDADDELSYAKRLQQADPAAGDKVAAPAAAARQARPAEEKPASAKPPAQVAVAQPRPEPASSPAPASAKPGAWIVQLSANKDRAAAATVARDLLAKGYPAFVLDPAPGAPTIYRVQVGGYPDRDKADQAARKLEREEHFKPYVRAR
jgi:cell division septation protein DedD